MNTTLSLNDDESINVRIVDALFIDVERIEDTDRVMLSLAVEGNLESFALSAASVVKIRERIMQKVVPH